MDCKHKYLAVCRLKNIRTQATGFQLQLTHCMNILCANCIIFFFKNFPSLIYLFAAIALSSGTHTHTSSQVSDIQSSSLSSSPAPFHLKHYRPYPFAHINTGKFLLEALILASTNPQYDKRLCIELPVVRTCCVHKLFRMSKQKQKTNLYTKVF